MNIFELNRYFWNFAFNNPEKIKPNHCSIYYFSLEHCNRLGWKKKFGFPTSMVLEATGIKSYSVFKKAFDELVEFGFFEVIEYSKNQYSSNIIALKENYKAPNKALDKALIKHDIKQSESTVQSIDSIDKQDTNIPTTEEAVNNDRHTSYKNQCLNDQQWKDAIFMQKVLKPETIEFALKDYNIHLIQQSEIKHSLKDYKSHFVNWVKKDVN